MFLNYQCLFVIVEGVNSEMRLKITKQSHGYFPSLSSKSCYHDQSKIVILSGQKYKFIKITITPQTSMGNTNHPTDHHYHYYHSYSSPNHPNSQIRRQSLALERNLLQSDYKVVKRLENPNNCLIMLEGSLQQRLNLMDDNGKQSNVGGNKKKGLEGKRLYFLKELNLGDKGKYEREMRKFHLMKFEQKNRQLQVDMMNEKQYQMSEQKIGMGIQGEHVGNGESKSCLLRLMKVLGQEQNNYCNNFYKISLLFQYYDITVQKEIEARIKHATPFNVHELWAILDVCVSSLLELLGEDHSPSIICRSSLTNSPNRENDGGMIQKQKSLVQFKEKDRDQLILLFHPNCIHVCDDGSLKCSHPYMVNQSEFLETFSDNAYYSPERIHYLNSIYNEIAHKNREGSGQKISIESCEVTIEESIFTMGLTILSAALLKPLQKHLYKQRITINERQQEDYLIQFAEGQLQKLLEQMFVKFWPKENDPSLQGENSKSCDYGELVVEIVAAMIEPHPSRRCSLKQLKNILDEYWQSFQFQQDQRDTGKRNSHQLSNENRRQQQNSSQHLQYANKNNSRWNINVSQEPHYPLHSFSNHLNNQEQIENTLNKNNASNKDLISGGIHENNNEFTNLQKTKHYSLSSLPKLAPTPSLQKYHQSQNMGTTTNHANLDQHTNVLEKNMGVVKKKKLKLVKKEHMESMKEGRNNPGVERKRSINSVICREMNILLGPQIKREEENQYFKKNTYKNAPNSDGWKQQKDNENSHRPNIMKKQKLQEEIQNLSQYQERQKIMTINESDPAIATPKYNNSSNSIRGILGKINTGTTNSHNNNRTDGMDFESGSMEYDEDSSISPYKQLIQLLQEDRRDSSLNYPSTYSTSNINNTASTNAQINSSHSVFIKNSKNILHRNESNKVLQTPSNHVDGYGSPSTSYPITISNAEFSIKNKEPFLANTYLNSDITNPYNIPSINPIRSTTTTNNSNNNNNNNISNSNNSNNNHNNNNSNKHIKMNTKAMSFKDKITAINQSSKGIEKSNTYPYNYNYKAHDNLDKSQINHFTTSQYTDTNSPTDFTQNRKQSAESLHISSHYSPRIDDTYLYTNPHLLKKIQTDLHELTFLKHQVKAQQTNASTLLINSSNLNTHICMSTNTDTLMPPLFDMRKITQEEDDESNYNMSKSTRNPDIFQKYQGKYFSEYRQQQQPDQYLLQQSQVISSLPLVSMKAIDSHEWQESGDKDSINQQCVTEKSQYLIPDDEDQPHFWRQQIEGNMTRIEYEGEYRNDMKNGKGILTYHPTPNNIDNIKELEKYNYNYEDFSIALADPDNGWATKYEGNFRDNMKEGFGTLVLCNGEKYEGEFKEDKVHGRGTYFCKMAQNNTSSKWKCIDGRWFKNQLREVLSSYHPAGYNN